MRLWLVPRSFCHQLTPRYKHVSGHLRQVWLPAYPPFAGDELATPDVKVRIYTPPGAKEKSRPLIVFCHGGGWKAGNLDTEDHSCRTVCGRVECIVVSVDYRLWPENDYQTMNDDCFAAFQWVSEIQMADRALPG